MRSTARDGEKEKFPKKKDEAVSNIFPKSRAGSDLLELIARTEGAQADYTALHVLLMAPC